MDLLRERGYAYNDIEARKVVEPARFGRGDIDPEQRPELAVAPARWSHLAHRLFGQVSRDNDLTLQQTQ